MKITEFVHKDTKCTFEYIRAGVLYYSCINLETEDYYLFPVPISDIGEATFGKQEKTIFLMRYIRQALAEKTIIKFEKTD